MNLKKAGKHQKWILKKHNFIDAIAVVTKGRKEIKVTDCIEGRSEKIRSGGGKGKERDLFWSCFVC